MPGAGKERQTGTSVCALESALRPPPRSAFGRSRCARRINRTTGEYDRFRRWQVMDDETFETPDLHIKLDEAQKINPDIKLGEFHRGAAGIIHFGRIGAQTAKQVIFQRFP